MEPLARTRSRPSILKIQSGGGVSFLIPPPPKSCVRQFWNVFVTLSLAITVVSVVVAISTWLVMFEISDNGFLPFIEISETQKLDAALLAAQDYSSVAQRTSMDLQLTIEGLDRRGNLTEAAVMDHLLAIVRNTLLDALYVGFPDGRLVGLEQNVLEGRLLSLTSLVSNASGLVLSRVNLRGEPREEVLFLPGFNATQRVWYEVGMDLANANGAWAGPYLSGEVPVNTITWPLPCTRGDGSEPFAVVGADISLRSAYRLLSQVVVSPSGRGALWLYAPGPDGVLLAVCNETLYGETLVPNVLTNVTSFESEVARDAMDHLANLNRSYTFVNGSVFWERVPSVLASEFRCSGVRWLLSSSQFLADAGLTVTMVVISPRNDYYTEFESAKRLGLAISLGVVTPLVAVVVLLLAYVCIARPLSRVEQGLSRVSKGQLVGQEAQLSKGRCRGFEYSPISEIGGLEHSYDKFLAAMRSFSKYVPSHVVDALLTSRKTAKLSVRAMEATVMLSDIADFTTITEQTPPTILVSLLREYFEAMVGCIEKQHGTVADYMGDAVFAFWLTSDGHFLHAVDACESALRQRDVLQSLRLQWRARGWAPLYARIGIDTGAVLAGTVGSASRFKYTAVGQPVDDVARYENLNKVYGTEIIIAERTWKHPEVADCFVARVLDVIEPGVVIRELCCRRDEATEKELEIERLSSEWLRLYLLREWTPCVHVLEQLMHMLDDTLKPGVELVMKRVKRYREHGVAVDWNGV